MLLSEWVKGRSNQLGLSTQSQELENKDYKDAQ